MIYIQSDKDRTMPSLFDSACAVYGAIDSAQEYRLTSFEEVASGKFDARIKQNLFVGSTEFMQEVFKRVGKTDVRLPMNADRPHEVITLAEAHKRVAGGERLFIKPMTIKLFTGLILDGAKYSCLTTVPEDTLVMTYKPFNKKIISEWRIYVHNNKIIDSRNYSGDFMAQPDYQWAYNLIRTTTKDFPRAYTIDAGVLVEHNNKHFNSIQESVVIEFNDMWAIGNYGIPNDLYLRLLTDRYFEIMKSQ